MYKYSLNETRELLDAVENWYKRRYDVTLADDEIMAVCGSQEGIAHVGFAFAGPNDLILAPVSYTHLLPAENMKTAHGSRCRMPSTAEKTSACWTGCRHRALTRSRSRRHITG